MPDKSTIKELFQQAHYQRTSGLERARDCAELTKSWYCPREGHDGNQDLPENFQSIGAWGSSTASHKIYLATYPHGLPWFMQAVKATIRFDPRSDPDKLNEAQQQLLLQDLVLQSLVESTGADDEDAENRIAGFRTSKLRSTTMAVITGDSLERINDDFSITVFARKSYVTKRDTEGRVLWHSTAEKKRLLELTDEQLSKAGIDKGKYARDPDPCLDLYTLVRWNPRSRVWTIEQEIDDKKINESEEKITPFVSTAIDLGPEEDYGRGLPEQNWGDLKTLDECRERLVDWVGLCSKAHPILDETSNMKEEDFNKPTGKVLRGRVEKGVWVDGTFLKVDKLNDLSFVAAFADRLESSLGRRFMSESGTVRDSERTTAFEVAEVTLREVESALGGWYPIFTDQQQVPTLRRIRHLAMAKGLVPIPPKGTVEVQILTGAAALTRLRQAANLESWVATVQALMGDQAPSFLNLDVVAQVLARYKNIYEPGIIKTPEQRAAEQQRMMQLQAEAQANQTAIETAGAVVQQAAAQAQPPS